MLWRRGWDSNPRYGSPYTAFPVLPVQPLLHLSLNLLPIAECQLPICVFGRHRVHRLRLSGHIVPISNRQCSWRRGWDSNPRWALTHSGFRDRCTNPLCDLSPFGDAVNGGRGERETRRTGEKCKSPNPRVPASPLHRVSPSPFPPSPLPASSASCLKKLLHHLAAFAFQNASSHFDSMIQEIGITNPKSRFHCSGALIPSAINQSLHPRLN